MTIRELIEILEEYDGEMEIVKSEYGYPNETYDIEKVMINVKKDNPRLALIPEL
jgi:hypothetical protein